MNAANLLGCMLTRMPTRMLARMPTRMPTRVPRALIVLAIASSSPMANVAGAQDARAVDALHDASARDAVRGILAAAPARGIPVEPLLTKVREGIAKRSTPERIRDAVSALAARLETAAAGVRPVQSVDELAAAAGALQAGVPVGTLRDMRKTWTARPLTVPLGVVTELVVNGAPAGQAGKHVRELMRAGATPAQLVAMGGAVRSDVAAGLAPGHSLALRSKGVLSLLGAPPLSTTITSPIRPDRPPR